MEPADPDPKPALNPISEETDIDIDAEARQAEAVQQEVQAATSGDQAMEELVRNSLLVCSPRLRYLECQFETSTTIS